MQNLSLAFFVFSDFACKQQLIANSLSFCLLSFIFALSFTQRFVYKEPISVLKKGVVKTIFLVLRPQTPSLLPWAQSHGPPRCLWLEPPLPQRDGEPSFGTFLEIGSRNKKITLFKIEKNCRACILSNSSKAWKIVLWSLYDIIMKL